MQSKKHSMVETLVTVFSGTFISWVLTLTVLPLFGYNVTIGDSLSITAIFTVAAIIRSYVVRRLFNYWSIKKWKLY